MNERKWRRLRKIGKRKYILLYWVLGWGLFTSLIYFTIEQIGAPVERWYLRLALAFVLFPLSGLIVGNMAWTSYEKKYHL